MILIECFRRIIFMVHEISARSKKELCGVLKHHDSLKENWLGSTSNGKIGDL